MCTALNYVSGNHYFGRNLDWNTDYGESVVITPRNYPIKFRCEASIEKHYAIMGMGIINSNYPLYFDGVNECGLCIAGLNFPENAIYTKPVSGMYNIASFEIMLWILSQCKTTAAARALLERTNITDTQFSESLSVTPMHWIVSDRYNSIVAEPMRDGVRVYDNPTGVLANNPPFPEQLQNLKNDIPYSTESQSRFKRAVKITRSAIQGYTEEACVNNLFGMLSRVGMIKTTENSQYTIYSACINATDGIYYYKLYNDETVYKLLMCDCDLSSNKLMSGNV